MEEEVMVVVNDKENIKQRSIKTICDRDIL